MLQFMVYVCVYIYIIFIVCLFDQVFLQEDRKPTKSGGILRYCWSRGNNVWH